MEQIEQLSKRAIKEHVFPGCVVGYVRADGKSEIWPFGQFTYDTASSEVGVDTVYDTASLTKSVATGCLTLHLIDCGKLSVQDKLIQYVPEFVNNFRDDVTIQHLLTYTIDGYGLTQFKNQTAAELHNTIMEKDFERTPGSTFKYTNIPAYLLGLVIERVAGKPIDVLSEELFYGPLGMRNTTFHPERRTKDSIVPTEEDMEWRERIIQGEVHDESAWIFAQVGRVVGQAGLFSTAPDLLRFMQMLLRGGEIDGRRYFSKEIVRAMYTNQIADIGEWNGLGWELNQPRYMGQSCTETTFGKTGFTGTVLIADASRNTALAILSNRIYPKRQPDASAINRFRSEISDAIFKYVQSL